MAFIRVGSRPVAWVDTETTGLNADIQEVIDVAVVFDRDVAERFHIPHLTFPDGADYAYYSSKVKPERMDLAEPKALEINGYTAEAWADAPSAASVVQVLQVLFKDVVLAGHNVPFDKGFLESMIQRTGSRFRFGHHLVDTTTLAYARLVPAGLEKLSLDSIRNFLGWPKAGGHAALFDALDARRLTKLLTADLPGVTREDWVARSGSGHIG